MNRRNFLKALPALGAGAVAATLLPETKIPEKYEGLRTSEGILVINVDGKKYCVPMVECIDQNA